MAVKFSLLLLFDGSGLLSVLSGSVDIMDVLSRHFFRINGIRGRGYGKIIREILYVTGVSFTGEERGRIQMT